MSKIVEMNLYYFENSFDNRSLFCAFSDESIIRDFMINMNFDAYRKIGKQIKEVEYE